MLSVSYSCCVNGICLADRPFTHCNIKALTRSKTSRVVYSAVRYINIVVEIEAESKKAPSIQGQGNTREGMFSNVMVIVVWVIMSPGPWAVEVRVWSKINQCPHRNIITPLTSVTGSDTLIVTFWRSHASLCLGTEWHALYANPLTRALSLCTSSYFTTKPISSGLSIQGTANAWPVYARFTGV